MKTKMFTLILGLLFFCSNSFAKIFRVGFTGTPLAGVDYTFAAAVSNANAGDTIQIYGNVTNGNATISKKLVILGFGYNLDVHPNLQVNNTNAPSSIDGIFFGPGSDGSVIKGVSCNSFQAGDYYSTGTAMSDITFERCYGDFLLFHRPGGGLLSNVKIISCAGNNVQMYDGANGVGVTNLQIYNSIFNQISLYNSATSAYIINCASYNGPGNTLYLTDAQVQVKNCIIYSHDYYNTNTNTIYENNFFGESQPNPLPPGSNNRWGQNWAAIFNRLGGIDDLPGYPGQAVFDENYYLLKSGSPAKNGGFDASNNPTDCGIFGGEAAYKYIVSGIPPIPAIYQLTPPADPKVTTNPYNVTISVRSNN
ncbi:MAG: hypothetical protein M9898_04350 [Chitinophagaceae bacterium]|nr:hypothetical protein [Chitinophagaceae bacterium]